MLFGISRPPATAGVQVFVGWGLPHQWQCEARPATGVWGLAPPRATRLTWAGFAQAPSADMFGESMCKLTDTDCRAVDTYFEMRSEGAPADASVPPERLACVGQILQGLDALPVSDPPQHLTERVIQAAHSRPWRPSAASRRERSGSANPPAALKRPSPACSLLVAL